MCQRDKGLFSMKKLIAFDFDKTLYDHQTLSIPESAERALRALRERGHIIVLATGRDMSTHYSMPRRASSRTAQRSLSVIRCCLSTTSTAVS